MNSYKSAVRILIGNATDDDIAQVRKELVGLVPSVPTDNGTAAFWILTIHASNSAKPRYRDFAHFLDGR